MQSRLLNLLIVLILIKFGHSTEFVLFICEIGAASATGSLFNYRTLGNLKGIDEVNDGCWRVSVKDYTASKCVDFCVTRLTQMQWFFKDGQGERKKMPRERTERVIKEDRERSARRARKSIREAALLLGADRMLTLTFAGCVKDLDKAGIAFKEFVVQVNKQFHGNKREMQYVCTFERQERGAIHFHLALNRFYYWKTLLELWQFAIAKAGLPFIINKHGKRQYGGIFINQKCKGKTKSGIASYIAKYIGKQDGKGVAEHGELVSKGEKRFWQSKISRASLITTKLYHESLDFIMYTLIRTPTEIEPVKIFCGSNWCDEPMICGEIDYSKHDKNAEPRVIKETQKVPEFKAIYDLFDTFGKASIMFNSVRSCLGLFGYETIENIRAHKQWVKTQSPEYALEQLQARLMERLELSALPPKEPDVYDFSHINKKTVTLRDRVGQLFNFTVLNSTLDEIRERFWQYEVLEVV